MASGMRHQQQFKKFVEEFNCRYQWVYIAGIKTKFNRKINPTFWKSKYAFFFPFSICTHVSDARAIYIMQIDFAEVKVLQQQNMPIVHHMHTWVCTVFKWNYEQHLYTHTLIPIINRFASTNEPLSSLLRNAQYKLLTHYDRHYLVYSLHQNLL